MERLFEQYRRRLAHTDLTFIRDLEQQISWHARLIGIKGARGTGKTTLLLQHIKKAFGNAPEKALYVSLDNLWFSDHSLEYLVDYFVKHGGTHIFLDEVHTYPNWAREIKNIYDEYPDLHIAFTGSSLLEILQSRIDLSRRALTYSLPCLSYREFLVLETGIPFSHHSLEDILLHHTQIVPDIVHAIKPLQYFDEYLKLGCFPYYLEGKEDYEQRLQETILMTLEQELPFLRNIEPAYVPKLKQLLTIIARSAPFIPNVSKLSERIGINRQTFLSYLKYLSDARLIRLLYRTTEGIGLLQKPDKIFLDNTNYMFLLGDGNPDVGNVRETFLANQLAEGHRIRFSLQSDFLVDDTHTIQVGGSNKTGKQLKGLDKAHVAADAIEYGTGREIPLWLFGFLY